MYRQFRLSISPTTYKPNLNNSASFKHKDIKLKQNITSKLRYQQPNDEQNQVSIRKRPFVVRKKGTVSIVDFSDILQQRIKLPNLTKNNQLSLRISESALIKDILSFPPTKTERRKIMKIPSDVVSNLQRRVLRSKSPPQLLSLQPRSIRSLPRLQTNVVAQQKTIDMLRIKLNKPKKKKYKTEFQIQPWNDDNQQLGSQTTLLRPIY